MRRRAPGIGGDVLEAIAADIAKCRNMAAAMRLDDLMRDDEPEDDGAGSTPDGGTPADNASP